jgi:hypothetical protein
MNSTHDIINERNYVRREIKEIKGNQNINPEDIEIIEDLTQIHEIKVRNQNSYPLEKEIDSICQRKIVEPNITLEGESIEKKTEQNNFEYINKNESLCPDCYNEEMIKEVLCDECGKNIDEGNENIHIGYVNAPFLKRNEEEEDIIETEHINNLIENIFGQLGNDEILNNYNSIKISFQELSENEKDEVIEGIKIKIENEEQENRFNNLIKLLY